MALKDVQKLIDAGKLGKTELCLPAFPDRFQQCLNEIRHSAGYTVQYLAQDLGRVAMIQVLLGALQTVSGGRDGWLRYADPANLENALAKLARRGVNSGDLCLLAAIAPMGSRLQSEDTSDQGLACIAGTSDGGTEAMRLSNGAKAIAATGAVGTLVLAWVVYELLHPKQSPLWPSPQPGPAPLPGPGPLPGPTLPPASPIPPIAPDAESEVQAVTTRILLAAPEVAPADADTAARRCVGNEILADLSGKPCLSMPIFLPGADAGLVAIHDEWVIASHPTWFMLTYESPADKKADRVFRDWYERKGNDRAGACAGDRSQRAVQCDEYPFYTTAEGGPGASLMEVPKVENMHEGNALWAMQRDPSCNMATVVGGRAVAYPGSRIQPFSVVPTVVPLTVDANRVVTYGGPPSTHVCGFSQVITGGAGGGGPIYS